MYKNNTTQYDERVNFYKLYKIDTRNEDKPYKAICPGNPTQRFATYSEAIFFFHSHEGRCLLSYNTNHQYKVLAYKFK